ncbi:MAG: hypothetical protein JW973_07425 [Bacteroidales bacterium]|nr:hypothetical protein [Bacteroidales bacterium]
MKTKILTSILSVLLLMWLFNHCSQDKKPAAKEKEPEDVLTELEQEEPDVSLKLYGIKSGIIEYKHTGQRTGTTTLYFDKYGHRSAIYSDMVMNNQADKGWTISFDDMVYMYKEGRKQGNKMKNTMIESLTKVNDLEKFTEETYDKMGFKPAGNEKYLGKECRVFTGDMGKVLTWNGLLMYMEMNVMGMTTKQEATKIDVNVRVNPSVFELPKDVTFTEMTIPEMGGMRP